MIAGMVLANLLYVVGAIVVASVVSGFVLLRHRRPKSLEAGIEMFSRELKALEPDRPGAVGRPTRLPPTSGPALGAALDGGAGSGGVRLGAGGSGTVRKSAVRVAGPAGTPVATTGSEETTRRNEAVSPAPDLEDGSG
jgi:hypothetical protein